jgi:hypothetical protein
LHVPAVDDPVSAEYVPASHATHGVPACVAYQPAAQLVQAEGCAAATGLDWPAVHSMQVLLLPVVG